MPKRKLIKTFVFHFKNIVSSSSPLMLLHIGLFGPVKITSVNYKIYGLVIVDDYRKQTRVKLQRHNKSHCVFSFFENKCKLKKNYFFYKIKKYLKIVTIKTNHGAEFKDKPFKFF